MERLIPVALPLPLARRGGRHRRAASAGTAAVVIPALELAASAARAIPGFGFTIEGILDVVLQIGKIAEEAKAAKEGCLALALRATTMAAEVARELCKLDPSVMQARYVQFSSFFATLERIKAYAVKLAGLSNFRRAIVRRAEIQQELVHLHRELDDSVRFLDIRHHVQTATTLDELRAMLGQQSELTQCRMGELSNRLQLLEDVNSKTLQLWGTAAQYDGDYRIYRPCDFERVQEIANHAQGNSTLVRVCRVRLNDSGREAVAKFHPKRDRAYSLKIELLKRSRLVGIEQLIGVSHPESEQPYYLVHAERKRLWDLVQGQSDELAFKIISRMFTTALKTLRYGDITGMAGPGWSMRAVFTDPFLLYFGSTIENSQYGLAQLNFIPYYTDADVQAGRVIFDLEVEIKRNPAVDYDADTTYTPWPAWLSRRFMNLSSFRPLRSIVDLAYAFARDIHARTRASMGYDAPGVMLKHASCGIGTFSDNSRSFRQLGDHRSGTCSVMQSATHLFHPALGGVRLNHHPQSGCHRICNLDESSHLALFHWRCHQGSVKTWREHAQRTAQRNGVPISSLWIVVVTTSSASTGLLRGRVSKPIFCFQYPHPASFIGPAHIAAGYWSFDESGLDGSIVQSVSRNERGGWSLTLQLSNLVFWMDIQMYVHCTRASERDHGASLQAGTLANDDQCTVSNFATSTETCDHQRNNPNLNNTEPMKCESETIGALEQKQFTLAEPLLRGSYHATAIIGWLCRQLRLEVAALMETQISLRAALIVLVLGIALIGALGYHY